MHPERLVGWVAGRASWRQPPRAQDEATCMSCRVEDRWSAGSHGKHRGVCRGMPEHAPMLTSTVARRGASIRCQLASSRHSTDQARSVGRRRRRSSTFSRSSFPTSTRIRDTSPTPLMPPVTLVATRTEPAPRRPDEPQAHPAGIETATSRFARCFHLPLGVRSRPAALLRPC